jgi:hypothetical protein
LGQYPRMLLHVCLQKELICITHYLQIHMRNCGGTFQKLFSVQGLNKVHIFNQGMTRQNPTNTQWRINLTPDASSFFRLQVLSERLDELLALTRLPRVSRTSLNQFKTTQFHNLHQIHFFNFRFHQFLVQGHKDDMKWFQAIDHSGPLHASTAQKLYVATQQKKNNKTNPGRRIGVWIVARSPSTILRNTNVKN